MPQLEQSLQTAEETAEQTQQRVHQLDARLTALQSLQDQVSRSGELEPWLDRNDLRRNAHLWQGIRIREGWEDALEAVLSERLNSIGLPDLGQTHGWLSEPPPGKAFLPPCHCGLGGRRARTRRTGAPDRLRHLHRRAPGGCAWRLARARLRFDRSGARHGCRCETCPPVPCWSVPRAMCSRPPASVFTPPIPKSMASCPVSAKSKPCSPSAPHSMPNSVGKSTTWLRAKSNSKNAGPRPIACGGQVSDLQETHHQLKLDHVRLSQLAERLKSRGEQIVRELAEIDAESTRESAQHEQAGRQMEALRADLVAMHASVEDARQAHAEADTALQASRTARPGSRAPASRGALSQKR